MSSGFHFHIIGAGRGGTSLLTGVIDAHPECEVHPEEYSTKFLMGRQWTSAECEPDPEVRIPMRIQNFLTACERKAAEHPGKLWGHKSTTEQIKGLDDINTESTFATDKCAIAANAEFDALNCFTKYVAHIKTVFILRDGRSCVCSKVRRTGQPVEEAIRRWKYSVRLLDALRARVKDLHVVKMEHLIRHPEENLRSICKFLGVTYTQEMLRGTQSTNMMEVYRRDGFYVSAIDVTDFDEPWLQDIREELVACGYPL